MNKLTTPEKQPTQTTKTNLKPLVAEVQISGAWRKSGGILVMKLEGHWFKVDPSQVIRPNFLAGKQQKTPDML